MGQLRIIGGNWRGRKILIPEALAKNPTLRPSTDRTRTVLFDWLRNINVINPTAKIADLFCGSGVLGLEAISQGALSVDFVDNNFPTINNLQKNFSILITKDNNLESENISSRCKFIIADVFEHIANINHQKRQYDLIFCDPPYVTSDYQRLLSKLAQIVFPQGFLYLESGKELPQNEILQNNWEIYRYKKISTSYLYLLQQNLELM